jgi:hypothetical protein
MEGNFKKISDALKDLKEESANFSCEKDGVSSVIEMLRQEKNKRFFFGKQALVWQFLFILLLIGNFTQGFLLMQSRRQVEIVRMPERTLKPPAEPEFVEKEPEEPARPLEQKPEEIKNIQPEILKDVQPKIHHPEVVTANYQETHITPQDGLNQLLKLYDLFETLSPDITLPKGENHV